MLVDGSRVAIAGGSAFKTYGFDQGLSNLGGSCMLQDLDGYLIVCTEHGLFAYDGRRFVNLGVAQGLREGGLVNDVIMTSRGNIAASYADDVVVSNRSTEPSTGPSALNFRSIWHDGEKDFLDDAHVIAPWRDGVALLTGGVPTAASVAADGSSHPVAMGYLPPELRQLAHSVRIFSIRGQLWTTSADGRICRAEPRSVVCFSTSQGLAPDQWYDIVAGPDRKLLARAAGSVAMFDPASARWTVTELPDQSDRYINYVRHLGIYRAPDGTFMTQADHGLALLGPSGWRELTVAEGAPSGTILHAMTDRTGQFWLRILGVGLVRWVGYGHWSSVEKSDGLSDGLVWQVTRAIGGSLWAATDTGVDRIDRDGKAYRVGLKIPGGSYAISATPDGTIWSGYGNHAIRIVDPATLAMKVVHTPPVNALAPGSGGRVYAGTEAGLLAFGGPDDPALFGQAANHVTVPVSDLAGDGAGGVFYLSGSRLRHYRSTGQDTEIVGALPPKRFDPSAIAYQSRGNVWVGGGGGLYRITVDDEDRVVSTLSIPEAETRSNTILALLIDHHGRVWVGTSLGISVFDGSRWMTLDTNSGLISNDVNAHGLYEDQDGSIWITTSDGLSQLHDPDGLFRSIPIRVLISEAALGGHPIAGRRLPYSQDALTFEFGTPDFGAEGSIVFRYRLSGVDARQVESANGNVRYPFVPPGRHQLEVVAYDTLTHAVSEPVHLAVNMAFPWWRQWWAEILFALLVFSAVYAFVRLRLRTALARQSELKRLVAEATEEIRLAETELRYRAAHDSLTGLLNRAEIERRLPARLAGQLADEAILVALLDIDHFKRVNDEQGHIGGDNALRALGRLVTRALRVGEDAGRYGGEEILLVLDDTDRTGATRIAELHRAVREETFGPNDARWSVTCSIGLAWARAGDDWESLIGRADDALYDAKRSGRDRIVESRSTPRPGPDLRSELDRLAAIAEYPAAGLAPKGLVRS